MLPPVAWDWLPCSMPSALEPRQGAQKQDRLSQVLETGFLKFRLGRSMQRPVGMRSASSCEIWASSSSRHRETAASLQPAVVFTVS